MSDEERRDYRHDAKKLVDRFESMLKNRESQYFDLDELESITEYYFQEGELRKALKVIRYGDSIFQEHPTLMLREAQILAIMGHHTRAIPRLKNLLHIEPSNDEAHLTLASVYSQLREHHEAIKHFQRLKEDLN